MNRAMPLHTASTVGLAGALACYLALLPTAVEAYAAVHEGLARISRSATRGRR